ncbi:MAG: hypothetical protein A2W35_06565 [Chloroflexi bacterium RBG_16_57_11]|nr:MAG: hypothetical protein A2W35_06565 [Chloroflexi bacterium RBG_16_57_11]HKZ02392.1 hypothetical protein [Pyrinomonadaceae bacterium]
MATPVSERGERTYTCDICKVQKRETNRWWLAVTHEGRLTIQPWSAATPTKGAAVVDICGCDCMAKLVSRWMSERL